MNVILNKKDLVSLFVKLNYLKINDTFKVCVYCLAHVRYPGNIYIS